MKVLETLTSLQRTKTSIHICNFIWYNKFYNKTPEPVWTGFFLVVDRLGPVFKGPVAVPEYLERSRPVVVASCLVLR